MDTSPVLPISPNFKQKTKVSFAGYGLIGELKIKKIKKK